jgi:hypothetical protein
VADTVLVATAEGHKVVQTVIALGGGDFTSSGYDASGKLIFTQVSVSNATGSTISNRYDDNGDGVVDRLQTIVTITNGDGSKTETRINSTGSEAATAVMVNRQVTTTSADGKVVRINRDSTRRMIECVAVNDNHRRRWAA